MFSQACVKNSVWAELSPPPPPRRLLQQTVHIILECILVSIVCSHAGVPWCVGPHHTASPIGICSLNKTCTVGILMECFLVKSRNSFIYSPSSDITLLESKVLHFPLSNHSHLTVCGEDITHCWVTELISFSSTQLEVLIIKLWQPSKLTTISLQIFSVIFTFHRKSNV